MRDYIKIADALFETENDLHKDPWIIERAIEQVCDRILRKTGLHVWIDANGYMDCLPPNAIHDDLALHHFKPVDGVSPYRLALAAGWIRVTSHNKGAQISIEVIKGRPTKAAKQSMIAIFDTFSDRVQRIDIDVADNETAKAKHTMFTDVRKAWNFFMKI